MNEKRCLGTVFVTEKKLQDFDNDDILKLKLCIVQHGVVTVPHQHMTPHDQKEFSMKLGHLVSQLDSPLIRKPWCNKEVPEVFLAGNTNEDGDVIVGIRNEIWHQDLEIMRSPGNHALNVLHAVILPEGGGDTQFLDTTLASVSSHCDPAMLEPLKDVSVTASTAYLPAYRGAITMEATHKIFQNHPVTDEPFLYLPGFNDNTEVTALRAAIIERLPIYSHKWETGDVLFWDNLTTLHRSGGAVLGQRLLHRTQVQYSADRHSCVL